MTSKNNSVLSENHMFWNAQRIFIISVTSFLIFTMMIGILFYQGYSIATKQLPLVDTTMEIKFEVTAAYLSFEKNIINADSESNKQIWHHLDEAGWYVNAMLLGGSNHEGRFYPITRQHVRDRIISINQLIEKLRSLFVQHNKNTRISIQTSDVSHKIDQVYSEFFEVTENIETQIQEQIEKDILQYWLLGCVLFILSLFLGLFISYFMYKREKSRNQILKSLGSSEARMRGLVNTLPDLIWLKDKEGVYLDCNTKVEAFFGHKRDQIIGKTDYDFVSKEEADFFRENDKAAEVLGKPRINEELLTYSIDGHKEWTETIKAPMYGYNAEFIGVLGIGRDITERKRIENTIKYQATHDGLTSLLNRVEAEKAFAQELDRSKRYGHNLSLFMVDIDFFKNVNDTYGHSFGDKVLKEFANNLEKNMRKIDINSRFGGEEFVVILPETIPSQAKVLAERLRKSINSMVIEEGDIKADITASIGIASYPKNGDNFRELLNEADSALYRAKEQGRNRVCVS
jgi:diguanylate cyclase (GGDEF)-like protein/PAS domain S-box-containing protein